MKLIRILQIITILLLFEEQYFIPYFINKGIYIYHFTGSIALLGFVLFSIKNKIVFQNNNIIKAGFLFLILLAVNCLFSGNVIDSFKYLLGIVLSVLFAFSVLVTFEKTQINSIIKLFSVLTIITSLIGLYDFFALHNDLPTFNTLPDDTKLTSGFRHFGTTADFAHIMLCILIPVQCSGLMKKPDKQDKILLIVAVILGVVLLIGTTRISVIISLAVSIILLFFFNLKYLKKKTILLIGSVSVAITALFLVLFPSIINSIIYRAELRILNRKSNTLAGDFFIDNSKLAWQLFTQHPIMGVGLGKSKIMVSGEEFSVHGTFFRLLSETGIVGCMSFMLLLVFIFSFVIRNMKRPNKKGSFFYQFLPFLIGLVISSIYNVHFFGFEFWLLLATIQLFFNQEKLFFSDTNK
ncbi:MAG: hypothetical protein ABI426_04135 [Flavobacterium sp.]